MALGVAGKAAPAHLTPAQVQLRIHLRAHARALGDALHLDGSQDTGHLMIEIAYEHWHRMLFARFLAESNLLMHPDGYPVSLADCKEDAATIKRRFRSGCATSSLSSMWPASKSAPSSGMCGTATKTASRRC